MRAVSVETVTLEPLKMQVKALAMVETVARTESDVLLAVFRSWLALHVGKQDRR